MMFFVCIILLLLVAIGAYYLNKRIESYNTEIAFGVTAFCVVFFLIIALTCLGCNRNSTKIDSKQLEENYIGLNYKIEALNKGLSDDFGINNNDIMNEIISYNKVVTKYQNLNSSIWFNWFYDDSVDNLKLIDYNAINFNN